MTHQCRMGHAPALDYLPLDAKPAHRTPQRQRLTAEEEERRRGLDKFNGEARLVREVQTPAADASRAAASPPSAPKFKPGDRVRLNELAARDCGGIREAVVTKVDTHGFAGPRIYFRSDDGIDQWHYEILLEPLPPPAPTGVWRSGKPERDGRYMVRDTALDAPGEIHPRIFFAGWWRTQHRADYICAYQDWQWLDTPQEPEAAS
jgi:hypothetical protein